jgi:beta-glucosidase
MKFLPYLCLLSITQVVAWAQTPINWPVEKAAPGTNPAVFATCRNDWMERFFVNLTRAKAGHVDLLFQGDSISQQWESSGREVWGERYRSAANFGIGGDCTENVLWRLQHGELDGISPKLIVLLIGTNNVKRDTPQQVAEGIAAVVKALRQSAPQSHVLLMGVFPRSQDPHAKVRADIQETNRLIAPLADGTTVTFLDLGKEFLEPDGKISAEIMPDMLHLSPRGYKIWADGIQKIVDKYCPPN